jgi:hypothetical protein
MKKIYFSDELDGTKEIEITDDEWEFLKFLIEDGADFHVAMFEDFKEDDELTKELGITDVKARFEANKNLFLKLKVLGVNTRDLEK